MSYIVSSSEKLRKSGAETETKALLYLMNFRPDSDDIHYFVVDFFNDLTGMDRMGKRLWDVQSKGAHNVSPKAVGKELVTLFKNYTSEFSFDSYILFIGSVTGTLRKDASLDVFDITNIQSAAISKIRQGLLEEGTEKTYIDNSTLTDINISAFLNKVVFVIDNDTDPCEYVKAIIKQHPNIVPEQKILRAIFNEIRDTQSGKKNIGVVEGITIETSDEALNYSRHLSANEIRLLALQRIINRDPLGKGIPAPFISIYNSWPPETQYDLLDECQGSLCRALFNKNAAEEFWALFENTYNLIIRNPNDTVQSIFNKLTAIPDCTDRCPDFNALSLKYFIAIIKDGIQQ